MKTTSLLLVPALTLGLFLGNAQAVDPAPTALHPEVQALLADLLKTLQDSSAAVPEPARTTAPIASSPGAGPVVKAPLGFASRLRTGSLASGALNAARSTPSGSLGGGTTSGFERLSPEAWRVLFPTVSER